MPNVQEIIVDLQLNTSDLDTAADKLEALGVIDKAAAAQFRAANVEIKNKEAALKAVAATAIKSGADSKKTIDELDKAVKNLTNDFVTGFSEGVSDALTEAGVSAEEFSEAMKKAGGEASTAKEQAILLADKLAALKSRLKGVQDDKSFTGLQKQVSDARQRVLETATTLERLRKTGGVGTEKFKELSEQLKKNQGELKSLEQEFQAVQKAANVDIKPAFEEAGKATESLKTRLNEVTKQLQVLKLEGKDNTAQYKALTKEAGNLRDAIGDVSAEINNAAANSQALDGLLSTVQGLAGGFAVAQGTAALFGDESEALQETLLRVNAAMAILQGLQQVQTVLQKESAAVRLVTNAQLAIENGLNSTSIVVRTGAAVAQRVLNAAMAANPIGILVVAIAGLITILATYGRSAAAAHRQTSALNVELSAGADNFKDREEAIRKSGENIVNALENEGAVGSKIAQQEIENQKLLVEARKQRLKELLQLQQDSPDADLEKRQELSKEIRRLQDEEINDRIQGNQLTAKLSIEQRKEELQGIADLAAARLAAATKNSSEELAAAKSLAIAKAKVDINAAGQNSAEILRIRAELDKQLNDLDRQFAQVRQQRNIDNLEIELAKASEISKQINDRQSQEELDIENRLILQKARLAILQEGLTQKEKNNIITRALLEIQAKERDFRKQSAIQTLEDLNSRTQAELTNVELTNKERLNLTIQSLLTTAAIEIEQNQGKVDKIKEIEKKRDADIRAARLQSIRQTVEEEIALRTATSGVDTRADEKLLSAQDAIRSASTEREKRAIEKRLDVRRLAIGQEIALIDQIAARESQNIDSRLNALNDSFTQGLISYKDYNLQYQQLTDEQAKITEDAEQKKRDAVAKTVEEAKKRQKELILQGLEVAQQVGNLLNQLAEQNSQRDQQRLDSQRSHIEELKKQGKISELEAEQRLKQLDQAERRIRRQQAIREKQLAIFNAIIATAVAVARAGNPILAAIAGVLGAAQVALIASKPIPQFKRGKKDAYHGPGVVGEAGAELIERDGQLYIAPKKTIVWLGKKDKVFNPKETIAMLEKPGLQTTKVLQMDQTTVHGERLDYEKLGKVIARNTQGVSLNIDGYKDFVIQGHAFDSYLNNRRSYK